MTYTGTYKVIDSSSIIILFPERPVDELLVIKCPHSGQTRKPLSGSYSSQNILTLDLARFAVLLLFVTEIN